MELSIKIAKEGHEIVIEHVDKSDVRVFTDIEQALAYIRQVLEMELSQRALEKQREVEIVSEEAHRTWYIRFPIERILSALKFVYECGIPDVKKALEEYCRVTGISKSNVRVILPTFTALRLQEGGRLTEQGKLIAKYMREGRLDLASDLLFECALSNTVLREILSEITTTDTNAIGNVVRAVLQRHGYNRHDEISYTTEFIRFLIRNSLKCQCFIVKNIICRYLREKQKIYINFVPSKCILDIFEEIMQYLRNTKPYIVQNILDNVGARIDKIRFVRDNDKMLIVDEQSGHVVQLVPKVILTREMLYASALRQELDKLRVELQQRLRSSNKMSYLIAVLILVNDMYTKLKLYLEHVLRDQSFSTKIIDLP